MIRGDVHRLKLPKGVGHEQHGERYGIVVQSDGLLARSTILMAPTSRSAAPASFRPEVLVRGEVTRVLVEQVGPSAVQRIGQRVGHLAPDEMWSVDEALATVLGLP